MVSTNALNATEQIMNWRLGGRTVGADLCGKMVFPGLGGRQPMFFKMLLSIRPNFVLGRALACACARAGLICTWARS